VLFLRLSQHLLIVAEMYDKFIDSMGFVGI